MITLQPMSLEEFHEWRDIAIQEYADDKSRAGNFPAEQALDLSRREFEKLLPDDIETENHFLFTIRNSINQRKVGMLWVMIRKEQKDVFVYDIRMDEMFRNRGYGRQTLQALESWAKEKSIRKLSLHVFGNNQRALHLYESFGFVTTNILMSKDIKE